MNLAYVNGQYLPRLDAAVSIEDRGYQFADGVYEVIWLKNGTLIDEAAHFKRLKRSLKELSIAMPTTERALSIITHELIRRNHAKQGDYMLYIQITRGTARRNHLFPKATRPSLVMTLTRFTPPTEAEINKGVKIITHPDIRWGRRDVKSIALLPNILARQKAGEAGAREAMLVNGDTVTEGSTANIFIVKRGVLITHPADNQILNGVTRLAILALAAKLQIKIEERAFTTKEVAAADEIFISSTTAGVLPVSQLDAKKITVGKIALKLYAAYQDYVSAQC
jgi:D-alanine transaminase